MIYRGPLQYHENSDNGDDDSLCEPEILDEAEIPLYNHENAELAKSKDLLLPLKKCVVWALLLSLVALAVGTTFYWKPCSSQHVAKGTATPTRPFTRNDEWIQYTTIHLFVHYIHILIFTNKLVVMMFVVLAIQMVMLTFNTSQIKLQYKCN